MNSNVTWAWEIRSDKGLNSGTVCAMDPRDALSRMLTSPLSDGRLLGEAHQVPVDVLAEAPGNFEQRLRIVTDRYRIRLDVA